MFSRFKRYSSRARSVQFKTETDEKGRSQENHAEGINQSEKANRSQEIPSSPKETEERKNIIDEKTDEQKAIAEEAKQMIRRPSLARRMSHTLLRRKSSTSKASTLADDEEEESMGNIELYTWGRNDYGQLLRDPRSEENHEEETTTPVNSNEFSIRNLDSSVSLFALGLFHSLVTTKRGNVWGAGDNEDGQLENNQKADFFNGAKILKGSDALQGKKIASVAVGLKHSALVTRDGLVLTWGSNESGQLGHSKDSTTKIAPKLLDGNVRRERAVQIACSEGATFILTEKGQVWSTGEATRGELGRPETLETGCSWLASPILGRLFCTPVSMISAGAAHVIAITVTGNALGWGWNRHGQLGFKPSLESSRYEPSPISLELPENVSWVACGTHHTAFASSKGNLLTGGSNEFGQLGREDDSPSFSIVPYFATTNLQVLKVACGSFHTLVLTSVGSVYAFGANTFSNIHSTGEENDKVMVPFECIPSKVLDIAAGGFSSSALVLKDNETDFKKKQFQRLSNRPRMHELDVKLLIKLSNEAIDTGSLGSLKGAIGEFHATGLNRSFLSPDTLSRVDIEGVRESLQVVWNAMTKKKEGEKWIVQKYIQLHQELSDLAAVATEADQLRAFFIAMLNPACEPMPSVCYAVLVRAVASLKDDPLSIFAKWCVTDCTSELFDSTILKPLLRVVNFAAEKRDWSAKGCAPAAVRILSRLHDFSLEVRGFVSFDKFYVNQPDNWAHHVLIEEWRRFVSRDRTAFSNHEFSLFEHPFVLSAEMKRNVMIFDQQNSQLQNAVTAAITQNGSPFFEITVRREFILEDALAVLLRAKKSDLTKPLRVIFENEPGLDWGGVRKEFFELLSINLFDPSKLDLFCHPDPDNDPSLLWLNARGKTAKLVAKAVKVQEKRKQRCTQSPPYFVSDSFACPKRCVTGLKEDYVRPQFCYCSVCGCRLHETVKILTCEDCRYFVCMTCKEEDDLEETKAWQQVVLVGALMGLSVYSSTLLDVHFPLALYSGLLDKPLLNPTITDLETIDHSLARGLQSMLDIQSDDGELFAEIFPDLRFYLEDLDIELEPNGFETIVTIENRERYVQRRCEFELRDGVAALFSALMNGFKAVVDVNGDAMSLFSPPELELMIVGVPDLDFDSLEKVSKYEGYEQNSSVVKWFWDICKHDLDADQRRMLLTFITGSGRAPIGGLANQSILIQRAGPDSDQLPTAHTCFNTLLLPEYASKFKLQEKLRIALLNAQGFGLQ